MSSTLRQRSKMIGLLVVLMAAVVFVVGNSVVESFDTGMHEGAVIGEATPSTIVQQISAFEEMEDAHNLLRAVPDVGRTRDGWFARRAYRGSPPSIPHVINEDMTLGGRACLTCHANGGFAPRFGTYTPVTPHPELTNCRQCHNPRRTSATFVASAFEPLSPPRLNQRAMEGAPPAIPHSLHMREDCLACHGGPGAVKEWRTTHPDRVNCRQCHAVASTDSVWSRPTDRLPE